jgi:hypothetical protein
MTACGSNPPAPSGGGGSGGSGSGGQNTITATIDGVFWRSTTASGFVRNGILSLSGAVVNGTTSETLSLAGAASVGAQSVGAGSGVNSTYLIVSPTMSSGWQAVSTLGSGTVNVQAITSTSATGTFSFSLQPSNGGATTVKSVTNGTFSITF